ncbi:MAG: AI-2E family transporter [Actinobacteria bacterium]|nr:AI-2E family transporter [Actinomycetota bacterium]
MGRDPMRIAARAAIGVAVVAVVTIGLWRVRDVIILLLLSLTLAAAMRPGVEALQRRGVPHVVAIGVFFVAVLGGLALFFWFAVPPAIDQAQQALSQRAIGGTGLRHNVLVWVQKELHKLPSGAAVIHPIATYGKQATGILAGIFFTLAATWYWISDGHRMLDAAVARVSEANRQRTRQTVLAIEQRLGAYTRLMFLMILMVGVVLSLGFYAVGLHYWLLLGGCVSILEVIPVIGPVIGVALVAVVGFSQSTHVMILALIVVIGFRQVQDYVINPHVMGSSVGFSPLVTLTTVSVVGLLFGGFAVILAIPVTSAVATLIDVFVLGHEPPAPVERRSSA